ncbi:MurR/RpiR family transcriptional regulator [Spiroplasma endosymbiont of Aspidapion aeneum]|uniref:MurR/RpiR family transcriptional regulator n=1 Tax=Spiroplasma endosymbiont of Aspidapion aeneum TaxID=3066276 RepID=UPI00313D19EC
MSLSNLYKEINKKKIAMNENNRLIAEYFLANWNNISDISIKKASHSTNQSPATITRFCKEFGFEGFINFRKEIMMINDNFVLNDYELIFNEESFMNMDSFVDKYFDIVDKQNQILKNLAKSDVISKFAKMILKSEQIIICGMNINYNQSIDFKNKLISSGKNCIVEQDLHLLQGITNASKKNKLIITISLSNENKEVIDLGKNALLHNAKWVHISSKPQKYNYTPTLTINLLDIESEFWNLYSIRGGALFNLYNLVFSNYIIFQKNEKK